jgi:hypothetical protein
VDERKRRNAKAISEDLKEIFISIPGIRIVFARLCGVCAG